MVDLLRDEGHTVLEAGDGGEAIDLLEDRLIVDEIGVLILDMNLPKVDGLGVLRHINLRGWTIPVVAISAEASNLKRARHHGACATLEKPFTLDRLLAAVGGVSHPATREPLDGAAR